MRPVKLIMQAFGSYGKLTQIDFQEPNQNLFLVTGDTGAGKTTIFDALVFALYGEASSSTNKKDGVVLQSQYAELNVEPFVELVFSEGTGENSLLYTVRRVPRHLKLLTRGAGKNTGSREVPGSVSGLKSVKLEILGTRITAMSIMSTVRFVSKRSVRLSSSSTWISR